MKVLRFIFFYLGPIIAVNAMIEMTIPELTRLYFLHNLTIGPIILPWLESWITIFVPVFVTLPFYYYITISSQKKMSTDSRKGNFIHYVTPLLYFIPMIFHGPYQALNHPWWMSAIASIYASILTIFLYFNSLDRNISSSPQRWGIATVALVLVITIAANIIA